MNRRLPRIAQRLTLNEQPIHALVDTLEEYMRRRQSMRTTAPKRRVLSDQSNSAGYCGHCLHRVSRAKSSSTHHRMRGADRQTAFADRRAPASGSNPADR
jgi:hypothetical protein